MQVIYNLNICKFLIIILIGFNINIQDSYTQGISSTNSVIVIGHNQNGTDESNTQHPENDCVSMTIPPNTSIPNNTHLDPCSTLIVLSVLDIQETQLIIKTTRGFFLNSDPIFVSFISGTLTNTFNGSTINLEDYNNLILNADANMIINLEGYEIMNGEYTLLLETLTSQVLKFDIIINM